MVLIQMIRVFDKFSDYDAITVAVDDDGIVRKEKGAYKCTLCIDDGDEIEGKLEIRKGGIAFSFNNLLLFKSLEGRLRKVKVKIFDKTHVKYFRGSYAVISDVTEKDTDTQE